jgi:hypothetical protein
VLQYLPRQDFPQPRANSDISLNEVGPIASAGWEDSTTESHLWEKICSLRGAVAVGAGLRQIGSPAPQISLARFAGIVDYHPEDLVVTVGAGTRLSYLNKVLGEHGQWLPVVPADGGDDSIGGLVAAGVDGGLKGSQGSVRDRVLGMRVVTPAFGPVFVGSRVVKSVAGYNLVRIMAGTRGALGVITSVVLKVSPGPSLKTWTEPFDGPLPLPDAWTRFSEVGTQWAARGLMRYEGRAFLYAAWEGPPDMAALPHGHPAVGPLPVLPAPPASILAAGAVPPNQSEALWLQSPSTSALQVDLQSGTFFAVLSDQAAWIPLEQTIRNLSGSLRLLRGFDASQLTLSSDPLWMGLKNQFDPEGCLQDFEEVSL